MKLLQTHNDKQTVIGVTELIESPTYFYLKLESAYSRGSGISHSLVDDVGTQTQIEIRDDCPPAPDYIAIAPRHC